MGCFASVAPPDLIKLDAGKNEILRDKVAYYNDFYNEAKKHMKEIINQEYHINKYLTRFILDAKSTGSLEAKLAECYLYIIIATLHSQQASKSDYNFKLSNYVPGILVNTDNLPDILKLKYKNLFKLSNLLPYIFHQLDELGTTIVNDIIVARDEIPREFKALADRNSKISLFAFARLERDWIDNYELISELGVRLDSLFHSAKSCVKVVNLVIKKADDNFLEIQRIVDQIDEWNYQTVPLALQEEVLKFVDKFLMPL